MAVSIPFDGPLSACHGPEMASANQFVVRTAHGTLLVVDPTTARLRHGEATSRSGTQVVALRHGEDGCVLVRRDSGPLAIGVSTDAVAKGTLIPFRLVAIDGPAQVGLCGADAHVLTAIPDDGLVVQDRNEIGGWECFSLVPDEGAPLALAASLASEAAFEQFCRDPASGPEEIAALLVPLGAERRRHVTDVLVERADHARIFSALRRFTSGGRDRSEWHAQTHLRGGIEAHGWVVGDHSYGIPSVIDADYGTLEIGRYCSIAGDVRIIVANHAVDRVTTYPFAAMHRIWPSAPSDKSDHVSRGVVIGNDVWIGQGAVILPGSRIGDGAIIGAAAVVAKTIPPFAVVVGNPARVVRHRFDDATIHRLLSVAWWHWPDEKVDRFIPLLLSGDVAGFLRRAEAS